MITYKLTQKFHLAIMPYIMEKVDGFEGTVNLMHNKETDQVTITFENKNDENAKEIECDMSMIPSQDDLMADYQTYKSSYKSPAEKNKTLRDSAKAKLVAGEKLTEDEASILTGI